MTAWHWVVLGSVTLAVACVGVSTIGSGTEPMSESGSSGVSLGGVSAIGGSAGSVETGGASLSGTATSGGQPSEAGSGVGTAGQSEPASGGAPPSGRCELDADCDDLSPPCQECADGSYACNKAFCNAGRCAHRNETCPAGCTSDQDCLTLGLGCLACDDGTKSCPTTHCQAGKCQTSFSGCDNVDPCEGLVCGTECKQCQNGQCAAVPLYCGVDGKCEPGIPQCGSDLKCRTPEDCGDPPPNCVACGADVCAAFECVDGACVFACPANPNPECTTTLDCPPSGVCHTCPDDRCATHVCWKGNCEVACEP